jgi:hypothetical protein
VVNLDMVAGASDANRARIAIAQQLRELLGATRSSAISPTRSAQAGRNQVHYVRSAALTVLNNPDNQETA